MDPLISSLVNHVAPFYCTERFHSPSALSQNAKRHPSRVFTVPPGIRIQVEDVGHGGLWLECGVLEEVFMAMTGGESFSCTYDRPQT